MSIAGCKDIKVIIKKLYELEEKLGGTKKLQDGKSKDEIDQMKIAIYENIKKVKDNWSDYIRKKESGKFRTSDLIRIKLDVEQTMQEIGQLVRSLRNKIINQKKNTKIPDAQKRINEESCTKMEGIFDILQREIRGEHVRYEDPSALAKKQEDADRHYVLGGSGGAGTTITRGQDWAREERQMNEEEGEVLKRWKQMDEQIDSRLDDLGTELDVLKQMAIDGGELMKDVRKDMKNADKEITIANTMIDTQNTRLKALLVKYRAPSKFCTDIILFILIIGLIGLMVNMIK